MDSNYEIEAMTDNKNDKITDELLGIIRTHLENSFDTKLIKTVTAKGYTLESNKKDSKVTFHLALENNKYYVVLKITNRGKTVVDEILHVDSKLDLVPAILGLTKKANAELKKVL